jgi:hypothetical protein
MRRLRSRLLVVGFALASVQCGPYWHSRGESVTAVTTPSLAVVIVSRSELRTDRSASIEERTLTSVIAIEDELQLRSIDAVDPALREGALYSLNGRSASYAIGRGQDGAAGPIGRIAAGSPQAIVETDDVHAIHGVRDGARTWSRDLPPPPTTAQCGASQVPLAQDARLDLAVSPDQTQIAAVRSYCYYQYSSTQPCARCVADVLRLSPTGEPAGEARTIEWPWGFTRPLDVELDDRGVLSFLAYAPATQTTRVSEQARDGTVTHPRSLPGWVQTIVPHGDGELRTERVVDESRSHARVVFVSRAGARRVILDRLDNHFFAMASRDGRAMIAVYDVFEREIRVIVLDAAGRERQDETFDLPVPR